MEIMVNDKSINELLNIASKYLTLKVFNKDYNIVAKHVVTKGFKIVKDDKNVVIEYNKINNFCEALFYLDANDDNSYTYQNSTTFSDLGIMVDCARNAILNVDMVKKTIVNLAFIGYSSMQLYVEDCMTLENEDMFGYMRGSYISKELKEIDEFAKLFGIEVIPCVQTLAHYNQLFKWGEYKVINDIDDILLADDENTYVLIEKIIKTMRECFSSNKININMDEAHNLGRGKYLDKHGLVDIYDLLLRHKTKVVEICKKYDFEPFMWSDMFIRNFNNRAYYVSNDNIDFKGLKVDDVGVVYWDYYHLKQKEYEMNMKVHKKFAKELIFAGGIWTWRGYLPYIQYTEATMFPAIRACKKYNIQKLFFTIWGDNGGECLRNYILGSLISLREYCNDVYDKDILNKKYLSLIGYSYNEWLKLDRPNFIDSKDAKKFNVNPTKYLLYMDPLLSLFDNKINLNHNKFFEKQSKTLHNLAKRNNEYSYLYELESKLCKALSYKAKLNLTIKEAYDLKDVDKMKTCLKDVINSIKYVEIFHNYYRTCWKKENKMMGFEVIDVRLGGVVSRLNYVKEILSEFIDNPSLVIEELEVERKNYKSSYITKNNETLLNDYRTIVSTSNL